MIPFFKNTFLFQQSHWILLALILITTDLLEGTDSISLTGNPATLSISTATAGSQPNSVSDTSTTYSISTSTVVAKITGKINTAMPTNTTLKVTLAAPTGGTSAGAIAMTTTAQNLVTAIPKNTIASSLVVTYNFSATVAAATTASATRTLTLTIN